MAEKKDGSGLIDLATVALAPAFIMAMVGSLVFFLIDVIYRGAYTERLHYTFFFFTFGAVLIARITIEQGRARAGLYAVGLAGACFVAMLAFVEYPTPLMKALGPVVNIGLMALVWFCADRLTWDCTHFDDARKASGQGVLAAVGLDEDHRRTPDDDEVELTAKQQKLGWLERVEAYRAERKKRPHTPGTRVLYFGLAALPIFALGQSLIPADDAARRSATFFDMAVYIGSALALLVTTNLMGLRRYLSERGAVISPVMTTSWLLLGGALILGFLVVGAILPRPHSETPLVNLGTNRTSDRNASKNAQVRDSSTGKGDGAAGKKTQKGDGKASAKGGEPKGGNGGEKGGGGGKGDSQGGKKSDGDAKGGDQGDKKGDGNDKGSKSDAKPSKADDKKGPNQKSDPDGSKGGDDSQSDDKQDGGDDKADDAKSDGNKSGSSGVAEKLSQISEAIGGFVKWVVWIVIAVAVIVGIAVFFLKYLSPFTTWAKNLLDWLRGLFARKETVRTPGGVEADAAEVKKRPAPFSAYTNPFARGGVERKPAEVVEYTFAALDGWAWDRDRGRKPGETPTEFAVRLGHEFADLDEPAFAVAQLYVRTQYSRGPVTKAELPAVEKLWDELEAQPHPARRG